jgi:hypothetical protein
MRWFVARDDPESNAAHRTGFRLRIAVQHGILAGAVATFISIGR